MFVKNISTVLSMLCSSKMAPLHISCYKQALPTLGEVHQMIATYRLHNSSSPVH